MDKRDLLKSVLQNFINDKHDEAKADFHQYLTMKSKEITGIGAPAPVSSSSVPAEVTPPADDVTPPTEVADDPATAAATDPIAAVEGATGTE